MRFRESIPTIVAHPNVEALARKNKGERVIHFSLNKPSIGTIKHPVLKENRGSIAIIRRNANKPKDIAILGDCMMLFSTEPTCFNNLRDVTATIWVKFVRKHKPEAESRK